MRLLRNTVIFFSIFLLLVNCAKKEKQVDLNIVKVETKPNITTLYYSGYVKPIQRVSVNNVPTPGVVIKRNFDYGNSVTKGQLLFVLSSQQLTKDYQDALSGYLRSKKSYGDVQYQMTGAEYLYKLKIISQQEYQNTKTQLFNANLDLNQATRRLQEVLAQLGLTEAAVQNLDSSNVNAVAAALAKAPSNVRFFAPVSGIALLPMEEGSKEPKAPFQLGMQVKAGQNLLLIGDMSGITVTIKITEVYIDKIKEGQLANVTSDAFLGIKLAGKVSHVGREASTDSGGTVPTFDVDVVVKNPSKEALDKIRVGMSADVELPIQGKPVIKIPLTAVVMVNGKPNVKKKDAVTGEWKIISIETGRTEQDEVEVLNGLKVGDEVAINASTN